MKYDRLKENIEILYMHNELHTPVMKLTDYKKPETDLIREIVSDCREILNKIEQGTLIELPCKVGDTVWEVSPFSEFPTAITAPNIHTILRWKEDEVFGRELFLTYEEAEKRLKELRE